MKRMGLILIVVLLLAMGAMGAGYAFWTQNLTVEGTVKTGSLDWKFVSPFNQLDTTVQFLDGGKDYNFNLADLNEDTWQIDRNVGYVGGRIENPHLITVTMNNVYPGYYNELYTYFRNIGTLPLKIRQVKLTYAGEDYNLTDDHSISTAVVTHDGCFAFRWIGDGTNGLVIPPSTTVKWAENFAIYIINPTPSTSTHQQLYDFTITLEGIQFNDPGP
jgi:hypothetical protein